MYRRVKRILSHPSRSPLIVVLACPFKPSGILVVLQEVVDSLQPRYKHCFVFNDGRNLPLSRMKNWLVLVLLLITAAGTFIPCCQVDDCAADRITSPSKNDDRKQEGTCSPFFACATCSGFVALSKSIQITPPIAVRQVHHEQIVKSDLLSYTSSFWQPPRVSQFQSY